MNKPLKPGEALQKLAKEKGVDKIVVMRPVNRKRLSLLGPQELAVEMLVEELNLCSSNNLIPCKDIWKGSDLTIAVPGKEGYCKYTVGARVCPHLILSWRELQDLLPSPPLPAFVIDLGKLGQHSQEEKASLKVQLAMTLTVIRRYLWDPHLILTSADEGTRNWLADMIGKAKIQVRSERPGRVLWSMSADKVIILRPDAEKPLTEQEVKNADAFLVGGIVDKIPRPGASRFLDTAVPWGKPRRIELKGSIIGVPDRINRIAEIIFRVRYDDIDIDKAIISAMTRRDLFRRLQVELLRASKGGKIPLGKEHFEKLRMWLPITRNDYLEAARRSRVIIRWNHES